MLAHAKKTIKECHTNSTITQRLELRANQTKSILFLLYWPV